MAGASETGREFAAAHAELLFTAQATVESARAFYRDVKDRLAEHGRDAQSLKIMPGIMPIVGGSRDEAQDNYQRLQAGIMSLPVWLLELLRPRLMKGFRELAWSATADSQLIAYEENLTNSNPLYMFKPLMAQAKWPSLMQLDALLLPVHILAGDSDGLTPASAGEALPKRLKNSRFKVLADCGHQLMLEKPDEALWSLRELLGCIDSRKISEK